MRLLPSLRAENGICEDQNARGWLFAAVLFDILLLTLQASLCAAFTGEQISDARSYLSLAEYCAENNTWYPNSSDLFAPYIFGNGYVNLLALCLRIRYSDIWIYALNIAFTQIVVLCSARIAYRITGSTRCACLCALSLCLMGGLWGEAVNARTELCFMATAMLSLLLLMGDAPLALFASGALLALSNWVRPMLVVYLPAGLLYLLVRRAGAKRMAAYLSGVVLIVVLIGSSVQRRFGAFIFQAQTMGVNMLMGANDEADGSYLSSFAEEGHAAYIPEGAGVTYAQKDELYRKNAVSWMLKHPVRFLSLIPAKLFYLLSTDTYGATAFFNNARETDNLAYLIELRDILLGRGERGLQAGDLVAIFSQATYFAVLLGYLLSVVRLLSRGIALDTLHLHCIFILFCGVTALTVGGARYHMPLLPIFCILSASLFARPCRKA